MKNKGLIETSIRGAVLGVAFTTLIFCAGYFFGKGLLSAISDSLYIVQFVEGEPGG